MKGNQMCLDTYFVGKRDDLYVYNLGARQNFYFTNTLLITSTTN